MIAIMQALATTLKRVQGLSVSTYATGTIKPPHAIVGVPAVLDYERAAAGARLDVEIVVTLYTSTAFDEIGSLRLAEYATPTGAKSIFAAIREDRTLGGAVEQIKVREFRPLSADEVGALGYFGGEFVCPIMVRGDQLA